MDRYEFKNVPKGSEREILVSAKTPFGANYNTKTGELDFSLLSPDATDVILCIFDKYKDASPVKCLDMERDPEQGVWKTSLLVNKQELYEKPIFFGYRVFGPNWTKADDFVPGKNRGSGYIAKADNVNHFRFDPNKLAVDPYSEWSHNPDEVEDQSVFRSDCKDYIRDTAKYAPKSVFKYYDDKIMPKVKTKRALCDEGFIAEVHLKDLTFLCENIKSQKGTYAAACEFAKYVKKMGVTMIEFLPLNEFNTDPERGSDLKNYWGYMPLSFFALTKAYLEKDDKGNPKQGVVLEEFRELVKAFHNEDIKVCMDVVYNHDGEAGNGSPDKNDIKYLSLTPIADKHYHRLDGQGCYRDNTGCGCDFNLVSNAGQNLVADAIAFFASQGVDAFRLDLAAALMDVSTDNNPIYYAPGGNCLAQKLVEMLEARGIKVDAPDENGDGINLIAEPWNFCFMHDNSQYQPGNFPNEWAEWSDIAREIIKRDTFEPHYLSPRDLKNYFDGLPDVYKGSKLPVNYASSHDEYTLFDLNSRNNLKPEEREKNIKKQIALILLARGIPMLALGDIIGHSKGGKRNTYNQDNYLNYLDYKKAMDENYEPIDTEAGRIYAFTRGLAEFRKNYSALRNRQPDSNVRYFGAQANEIHLYNSYYWQNYNADFFAFLIEVENPIYIVSSNHHVPITTVLPKFSDAKNWHKVCDSADIYFEVCPNGHEEPFKDKTFTLSAGSICVFVRR